MSVAERARQELAWRGYANNAERFAEKHWYIKHPNGRRLLELREPQREALRNFASGGNWLTLKARQIGWSTIVTYYVFWRAYFNPDVEVLLISRTERDAEKLLKMIKFGFERLPKWLLAKGPKLMNNNNSSMQFDNGSTIWSLPSASDPGRGFSGSVVVVDEWAFLPNGDDAWASIEPVADIGGQIIGLSTANGVGNWFHTNWEKAVRGESSFKTMFYSWRAVPERDDAWYEQKKADMLSWQLAQEYPSDPEEAFISSGNIVFDKDLLKAMAIQTPRIGVLGRLAMRAYEFRDGAGELRVWEFPREDHVYVIGADVAEGLAHGDASSAHVIDVKEERVVAHWHGRFETDLFAEALFALGIWYHGCLLGVEANNHGHSVIKELRKLSYPRLYRARGGAANATTTVAPRYGWWTDKYSKAVMVDDLGKSLRTGLQVPCEHTVHELMTFARDERGKMAGQPFDDRVISLGIANQMRQFAFLPEYQPVVDREWTMDWWAESADERSAAPLVIGGGNVRRAA